MEHRYIWNQMYLITSQVSRVYTFVKRYALCLTFDIF